MTNDRFADFHTRWYASQYQDCRQQVILHFLRAGYALSSSVNVSGKSLPSGQWLAKTYLISSTLRKQSDNSPCTSFWYLSDEFRADARGRSKRAFKDGNVGPARSISGDSSFNISFVEHQ